MHGRESHWLVGLLALALITVGSGQPGVAQDAGEQDPDPGAPVPEARPRKFDDTVITAGLVPVLEFFKFIQAASGEPLAHPGPAVGPQYRATALVRVPHRVSGFTAELARIFLEENGYEFFRARASDGHWRLRVQHPLAGVHGSPETTLVLGDTTDACTEDDLTLVTVLLPLRRSDARELQLALLQLLRLDNSRPAVTRCIGIHSPPALLVRGRLSVVRHLEHLVRAAEQPSPGTVTRRVPLQVADAGHVAGVLTALLRQGDRWDTRVTPEAESETLVLEGRDADRLEMLEQVIQKLDVDPVESNH